MLHLQFGPSRDALWIEAARALGLDLREEEDATRGLPLSAVIDTPGIRNPMAGTLDGVRVSVRCDEDVPRPLFTNVPQDTSHSSRRARRRFTALDDDAPRTLYAEVSARFEHPLFLGLRARVNVTEVRGFRGPPVVACDMARATNLLSTRGADGWCPTDMMGATARTEVNANVTVTMTDAGVTCELRPSIRHPIAALNVFCEAVRISWAMGAIVPIVKRVQETRKAIGPADWERNLVAEWGAVAGERGLELDADALAVAGKLEGLRLRLAVEGGEGELFSRLVARFEPRLKLGLELRGYNWLPRGWAGKALGFLSGSAPPLGDAEFDKTFYLCGTPKPEVYPRLGPDVRQRLLRLRACAREPGNNTREIRVDDHGIFAAFKGVPPRDALGSRLDDLREVARALRG